MTIDSPINSATPPTLPCAHTASRHPCHRNARTPSHLEVRRALAARKSCTSQRDGPRCPGGLRASRSDSCCTQKRRGSRPSTLAPRISHLAAGRICTRRRVLRPHPASLLARTAGRDRARAASGSSRGTSRAASYPQTSTSSLRACDGMLLDAAGARSEPCPDILTISM